MDTLKISDIMFINNNLKFSTNSFHINSITKLCNMDIVVSYYLCTVAIIEVSHLLRRKKHNLHY